MPEIITEHWKTLLGIWVAVNLVSGMPSPNGTGPTASWWYKWLFSSLHGVAGMIPRIVATVFPQLSRFIPGTNGGNVPDAPKAGQ